MKDEDDDSSFDPRLFWAESNGEDVTLLVLEKRKFDNDVLLLKYMEMRPRTIQDIALHFDWSFQKSRAQVQSLRTRSVVFETDKVKGTKQMIYTVKSRPIRLIFN